MGAQFRNSGLYVSGAAKAIVEGVRKLATLLHVNPTTKRPRLRVLDTCKNVCETIPRISWRLDKFGDPIEGEFAPGVPLHAADALRYAAQCATRNDGDGIPVRPTSYVLPGAGVRSGFRRGLSVPVRQLGSQRRSRFGIVTPLFVGHMVCESMAEKVVRLGLQPEAGWLYFLRHNGEVWRTRSGDRAQGASERMAVATFTREPGWLYYLDREGDVSRARRALRSSSAVAATSEPDDHVHEPEPSLVGPIEKVAELRIHREPGYLYFFRGADLWRTRMKRVDEPAPPGPEAELIAEGCFEPEAGWRYFLDSHGDVSRGRTEAKTDDTPL